MTDLEGYILDEWTEDYRAGRIGRREFLRRTAVFSRGAAAGLAVLSGRGFAAASDEMTQAAAGPAPAPARAAVVTVAPDDPAIEARMVSFPSGETTILASLALPRRVPGWLS